jgi:hypothetical protein
MISSRTPCQLNKHSRPGVFYHYAPGVHLTKILRDGYLRPSNAGTPSTEPLLWFSTNPLWEPTATKVSIDSTGQLFSLTQQQQAIIFGCVRFGLSADDPRFMPWDLAVTRAGFERAVIRSLETVGIKMGGQPSDWFGAFAKIAISELTFEVLDPALGWLESGLDEVAAVWLRPNGSWEREETGEEVG